VLHLVPDTESAFRELGRVVEKKGTVVTDLQPHDQDGSAPRWGTRTSDSRRTICAGSRGRAGWSATNRSR
jgi:ubiquinone/menaquinone biosynthesis C-methylase UbiE